MIGEKKKLSRPDWIKQLIKGRKSDEQILTDLEKGNPDEGINPCPSPFNGIILKKVKKQLDE